jgi:DNA-binding NarL/FixJ family response regulator
MNKSKYDKPSLAPLSKTETRIVSLLAKGLSNREIARQTNRSPATVKYHLKNIFWKLGATSRLQVILLTMPEQPQRVTQSVAHEAVAAV